MEKDYFVNKTRKNKEKKIEYYINKELMII